MDMKQTRKVIVYAALGVAVAAIVAGAVKKSRKRKTAKVLKKAADEGYETATDILYDGKLNHKSEKLKYGPVLPQ